MDDAELESAVEESLAEGLSTSVTSYTFGRKTVVRDPQKTLNDFNILMKLRGLQSPKRGLNVGQIDSAR